MIAKIRKKRSPPTMANSTRPCPEDPDRCLRLARV
jgi:hypothetical protein